MTSSIPIFKKILTLCNYTKEEQNKIIKEWRKQEIKDEILLTSSIINITFIFYLISMVI